MFQARLFGVLESRGAGDAVRQARWGIMWDRLTTTGRHYANGIIKKCSYLGQASCGVRWERKSQREKGGITSRLCAPSFASLVILIFLLFFFFLSSTTWLSGLLMRQRPKERCCVRGVPLWCHVCMCVSVCMCLWWNAENLLQEIKQVKANS